MKAHKNIVLMILVPFFMLGLFIFKSYNIRDENVFTNRRIVFLYNLKNKTNNLLENVDFYVTVPIKNASFQRTKSLNASHPFTQMYDSNNQQIIKFEFNNFPPFSEKIIRIYADLEMKAKPEAINIKDKFNFLKPTEYIESENQKIKKIAMTCKKSSDLLTVKKIFEWIVSNVEYSGFNPKRRGAISTLKTRSGDCTEYMDLMVALCRALEIPAKEVSGYVCPSDMIIDQSTYHNWAEVYLEGKWRVVDPSNRIFIENESNYIVMKYSGDENKDTIERYKISTDHVSVITSTK